jgi:hypothetical protein
LREYPAKTRYKIRRRTTLRAKREKFFITSSQSWVVAITDVEAEPALV